MCHFKFSLSVFPSVHSLSLFPSFSQYSCRQSSLASVCVYSRPLGTALQLIWGRVSPCPSFSLSLSHKSLTSLLASGLCAGLPIVARVVSQVSGLHRSCCHPAAKVSGILEDRKCRSRRGQSVLRWSGWSIDDGSMISALWLTQMYWNIIS